MIKKSTSFSSTAFGKGSIGYDEIVMFVFRKIHVRYRFELGIEEFGLIFCFVVESGGLFGGISFHHFTARLMVFAVHFDFHCASRIMLLGLVLKIGDEFFNALGKAKRLRRWCICWSKWERWPLVNASNDFLIW
jgi:hypothetical protein